MGSMLRRGAINSGCAATAEPNQVGGLTATGGSGQISLNWTADSTPSPNAATSYVVERSIDGLGSWSTIATNVTTNSYVDSGLGSSVTRHYRVSSVNCFGGALPSATANATTAAGSISPSWSLDFSTGTPSGYTLTRASSGTYVDSSGYIASASTNVARLTHNSSGSRLGLLVEGQRTNQFVRSDNWSTGWSLASLTQTAAAATSPENANTATRLVETSATGPHETYLAGNSNNACFSLYMKADQRTAASLSIYRANGDWMAATFDLASGAAGAVAVGPSSGWSSTASSISNVGNGWYRCEIRGTHSSSGQLSCTISTNTTANPTRQATNGVESYAGNTANGIYVWGAQLEFVNGPATSYIATTGSTVTRSADLAHVLDSSITSWGDPGALVVHFYPPGQAGTLISTDDASTAQVGIEASTTTAARAFWSSGSTATGTIGTGVQKAVHYWTGSTSKFCINGGTVQSGTNNLTIGNTDFVTLGAEATDSAGVPGTFSQYANCVIRKVEFYSGTLTDANLQTITT